MLFYSFFKTLVGKHVVVELKNNLCLSETLHSVDQYLNVKLEGVSVVEDGGVSSAGRCEELLRARERRKVRAHEQSGCRYRASAGRRAARGHAGRVRVSVMTLHCAALDHARAKSKG